MNGETFLLPVLRLCRAVLIPGMKMTMELGRKEDVQAVLAAFHEDKKIFITAQIFPEDEDPGPDRLYSFGCLADIDSLEPASEGKHRVSVTGTARARILTREKAAGKAFLSAAVAEVPFENDLSETEAEARVRAISSLLREYGRSNPMFAREFIKKLEIGEHDLLEPSLRKTITVLPWDYLVRQRYLETETLSGLYDFVSELIIRETGVSRLHGEIMAKTKTAMDKSQREYFLREQMKVIRTELGEDAEKRSDEYLKKLKTLKAPQSVVEKLSTEISRFKGMPSGSQEAAVLDTYIETLLNMPWDAVSHENTDLFHAKRILDHDHCGLSDVKERILEHLAVRTLTGSENAAVLCLVGPPGTGKTSVARSIARALGIKYVRLSLGGVHDEAEIRGHRRTYVGAMPGKIVKALTAAGTSNPLMLLDEVDKVGRDARGDVSSALLEVLDREQNFAFQDHYAELPVDLSRVFFIATANDASAIPAPLLDRMEIIELSGYTETEKFCIAKEHLWPKQLDKNGLSKNQLTITAAALKKIIHCYTREAGVRGLEKQLAVICRKTAKNMLEGKEIPAKLSSKMLEEYLGPQKRDDTKVSDTAMVGEVCGLAWTAAGGEVLSVEAAAVPGKGEICLTGHMGDVMKESARAAYTFVRSVCTDADEEDFIASHDIHVHIPEGAVPKDGPSAGITMAVAIYSVVTGKKISPSLAMTGEITLSGRVLPIGGLKEKLLAAKMYGIKKVLVPQKNMTDVKRLDAEITQDLDIRYVKDMREVMAEVF